MLGFGDRAGGMLGLIGEVGFSGVTGLAVFVDAVEEGREGVVIGLGDRVELVGMALRAAEREAQPGRAHGVHAVQDVIDARLLGVAAALAVGHMVALEAGRELLLGGRIREQVTGELFEGELVVRCVTVEGFDDPVAPRPVVAGRIRLEAVGVRVTRGIEPPHGHAFAVMRRGEETVDGSLISPGRSVGDERGGLGLRRRQSDEVEGETAQQGVLRGFLRRGQSFGGELLADEVIDRVAGRGGLHGGFESPVLPPDGALGDPATQDIHLLLGQPGLVGLGRRHELILVGGDDAFDQGADVRLAGHEGFLGDGRLADVQPQLGLAVRFVLAVAAEAVVGEDGQDVAAEADRLRRGSGEGERQEGEEQRGRLFHLGVILRRSRQF